jgi:hypothetical protein
MQFAQDLENSLRSMWENWCAGLPAASITSVSPPDEATLAASERVQIVSATQLSEADFWQKSALGQSMRQHMATDSRLSISVAFENRRGLSELFNQAIAQNEENTVLVFVHDDVWLDEAFLVDSVLAGLCAFDVIGVAGNRRRLPKQPAWPFVDLNCTWDERDHLSGRVAHGRDGHGQLGVYGPTPAACVLLDGVLLAARNGTLRQHQMQFDPQFDFHFYDLDFCRSATQAGLRLGTWPVALTHQSGGAFGSARWRQLYGQYMQKWKD